VTLIRINETRLLNNLASLANIGKTPDGGVSRPALSEADLVGREWFKQKIQEAGPYAILPCGIGLA